MSPQTPQDYRDKAAACDELAARATTHDIRMTMLYVASTWRELADAEEAKQQPPAGR